LLIFRDSGTIAAMARSYAFAAAALLLALAACQPGPASPPRHVAAALPGASLSTVRVEELRGLARQLDALARTRARSAELEQHMPRWVFARGGAAREPVSEALRRELLAILAAPAAEPRLRSFAALRLAGDLDLADLPAFGPLAEERADAGDFPLEVLVSQRMEPSYAVRWGRLTLGDVARLALRRLTGADLATRADVEAWQREHPDPRRSFAYWERTLEAQDEGTRRARLTELRDADPELFVRILLAEKHRWHFAWWEQQDLERVVRERIGPARLVRLLGREEAWPELAEADRFDAFAAWILGHAGELFSPGDAAGLLAVWEKQGATYPTADTASTLAIVAARYNPGERVRIVEATAGYLHQFRGRVLAELVTHGLPAEATRVERWFRGADLSEDARDDVREGILDGLASLGPRARSILARLVVDPSFSTRSDRVVVAVVRAVEAAGARDVCPDVDALRPRLHKGGYDKAAEDARAERARRECIPRARRWLASGRSG
jgi:hypothetical protein